MSLKSGICEPTSHQHPYRQDARLASVNVRSLTDGCLSPVPAVAGLSYRPRKRRPFMYLDGAAHSKSDWEPRNTQVKPHFIAASRSSRCTLANFVKLSATPYGSSSLRS